MSSLVSLFLHLSILHYIVIFLYNLSFEPDLEGMLCSFEPKSKAPFSSRKFSTLSKIQNMKIFNVF